MRYGYPRRTDILSRPELLGSVEQEELSSEIKRVASRIQTAARQEVAEENLALLRTELLELQEQLKGAVWAHVRECQVVATTTAQAYAGSSPINGIIWDTLLVDEVTMVPPAICMYLSALAKKRLLLAGDPRQLGPVYEERSGDDKDAYEWMGRDIFDFANIAEGSGETRRIKVHDKRLVRITSQRRCTQDIWSRIQYLYEGVSTNVDESRLKHLRLLPPNKDKGVVVVDASRVCVEAVCEKVYQSWHNIKTAEKIVEIAMTLLETASVHGICPSVAIITPYRAQYRLIKQSIKTVGLNQHIDVGTIHQFQGSEADIVLFDVVDGPGRSRLGKLLRGDAGLRLLNVAISRARGKFVILVDQTWCKDAMRREDNPILWDLISELPASDFKPNSTFKDAPVTLSGKSELCSIETGTSRTEIQILTRGSISEAIIDKMKVGESFIIKNRSAKSQLNQILSTMGLQANYDNHQHCTRWIGSNGRYRIDHDLSKVTREA